MEVVADEYVGLKSLNEFLGYLAKGWRVRDISVSDSVNVGCRDRTFRIYQCLKVCGWLTVGIHLDKPDLNRTVMERT
jgi:hypothetical protein